MLLLMCDVLELPLLLAYLDAFAALKFVFSRVAERCLGVQTV